MYKINFELPEKGIKQTWLADKLGKRFNGVLDFCNYLKQPTIHILYEIADLLAVDVKDLLVSNKLEIK